MDRFSKLVISISLASAVSFANAGYAQLSPPVGWTAGSGLSSGAGGSFNFGNAANSAQLVNGTVRTNAALNVGGRAVSIPATMRFAANAPRIASALIFMNPTLRVAASIAMWLGVGKIIWDVAEGKWKVRDDSINTGPYEYRVTNMGIDTGWLGDFETACDRFASALSGHPGYQGASIIRYLPNDLVCHYQYTYNNSSYNDGLYVARRNNPNAGTEVKWRPIEQEEFDERIRQNPMPEALPEALPHPLPVELPQIQPTFVPTGNPVPNPSFDPSKEVGPDNQPWNQPGVRVVPAPVPGSPWQVDLQPIDRPVGSPNPDPNPKPDPEGNPDDKPKEKDPGLCELYPEILACAKLDEPPSNDLQNIEKPISITPDAGWGSEDAACPAPRVLNVQGQQIAIPFDLFCTYMQGMRPIIIAMAWLSAAFILIGARE